MGAGDHFSYTEAMEVPGPVVAGLGSTELGLIYVVLSLRFLRPLVMKVLPAPGQGPSEKQQVEGFWCVPASALQTGFQRTLTCVRWERHRAMHGATACWVKLHAQRFCLLPEKLQKIESSCSVCTARRPLLRQSSGIFQA